MNLLCEYVLGLLIGWIEQHVDRHRQHVEPTQQCRGGRARRHALRRRRQWWHQLPELSGALQPQDQHLGRSCRHEYTQVSHIYKENRGYGLFFYIMLHRKRQKEKRWEKNLGWILGNKLNTPLANWASRMTQFSLYACITSAGSEEYGNSLCGVFFVLVFLALSSFYPYFCASNKHDTLLKGFEKHHRPSLSFTLT